MQEEAAVHAWSVLRGSPLLTPENTSVPFSFEKSSSRSYVAIGNGDRKHVIQKPYNNDRKHVMRMNESHTTITLEVMFLLSNLNTL